MIRQRTCRGCAVQFHLNAVCFGTRDVDIAALHPEVLLTMQAVFLGTGNVQCQVLHLHILLTTDGVTCVTCHIQRTFAFYLKVTFGIDTSLPTAVSTVSKCVDSSIAGT